jgi:ketosteroid isomerase-like protein
MKIILSTAVSVLILFSACSQQEKMDQLKEELLKTDKAFSSRSKEVGNHKAFLEYAAPEAVLLMQNHIPIIGKREIREYFDSQSDTVYTLTWKPSYARIAESGDLGYTYGIYTMKTKEKPYDTYRGTYVSIWEKNKKGKWRFVLDSGNSGLGDNQD